MQLYKNTDTSVRLLCVFEIEKLINIIYWIYTDIKLQQFPVYSFRFLKFYYKKSLLFFLIAKANALIKVIYLVFD